MKKLVVLLPFLALFLFSCDETDDLPMEDCGITLELDQPGYDSTNSDDFDIQSAEVDGSCFRATVTHGGGCGTQNWRLLAHTNDFPLSIPPLLNMKIVLDNQDTCEALLTSEISFDIQELWDLTSGNGYMNIALEGYNGVIALDE